MKLNLEDKLKIIKLKEDGFIETSIAKMFSVNRSTISTITRQYREHGIKSFKFKGKNVKYPPDFKMENDLLKKLRALVGQRTQQPKKKK